MGEVKAKEKDMPVGAGKYDTECTAVRLTTNAEAILLIVVEGNRGTGFSMQAPIEYVQAAPALLRNVADQIEQTGGMAARAEPIEDSDDA